MPQAPVYSLHLALLRQSLPGLGVDGVLVPRSDEFLGEYVPPSSERIAWLTGFTGSAGMAVVLQDRAAVFTDGRYTTQVAAQTDPALWERRHLIEQPPQEWLAEHAAGLRIGYDPRLHPQSFIDKMTGSGAVLVPLAANPIDDIWRDRPAPPQAPAVPQPLDLAGQSSEEKRAAAAAALRAAGEDAAVLADAHSVAWLLNIRGGDLSYTPLALGSAILHADASVDLFMEPAKLGPETRAYLGNRVTIHPPAALGEVLAGLGGRRVRLDPDLTPVWYAATLQEAGAHLIQGEDPVRLPRACKNPVEQEGARTAHRRDALAMVRFLAWFSAEAPKGGLTEISAAERLLAFRAALPLFRAESFPAISGAGENGAIIHYRAEPGTNRPIRADECYLIDSGAQFTDGTTDVTRTLWTGPGRPPADLVERYTRVLRGHVALSTLRFPQGAAGPHLDAVARRPLWDVGLDYDHGTGHGVGSFLSVHEGPVAFSRAAKPVPLRPGMILSNEPGFYLPGAYGIRIENLLLTRQAQEFPGQAKPFLDFETLTLAPYERRLIDVALLTAEERAWIDAYHARVLAEVGQGLEEEVAEWLARACAPL
ncbi:aminopeptidase P family protein [Roseomonas marmotae]|uniref:Aminopeptidase P family protein n=1 Tax=Roseomonas marmotae TaxID=2768161 RepID=A0ABS3KBJ7_9PROT|nr:aminopeptidase P family protein [Roseomonas marmotae]MBO1074817.1 aminopeptidase P family protein [Roseomonas marmotae]QTI80675.1 aminopeptidase P family protein [Roseomonas marmotae]